MPTTSPLKKIRAGAMIRWTRRTRAIAPKSRLVCLLLLSSLLGAFVGAEVNDDSDDDFLDDLEDEEAAEEYVITSPKHINDLWHESIKEHMKKGEKIDIREGGYTYKLAEKEAHEQLAIRPKSQKRAQTNALLAGPTVRYLGGGEDGAESGNAGAVLQANQGSQALVMNEL
jgi:hypothetical protein